MRIYANYHRHSHYTNVLIPDSIATNEDYAKRAVEIGDPLLSSVEHGWAGRYIETYRLAKQNNLKCLIGAEAYWVKDRTQPDSTNCHMCVMAKNENGRRALNDALSEANLTGFYFKPRLDLELLHSLPADDIWITTACVAGWKYEDMDEIVSDLHDHFGNNMFLEVQYHNTEKQIELNSHILKLHDKLKVPIIMGCDSHYINEKDAQYRSDFIESKNISYPDEEGWYLDYPDGDTAYNRFAVQAVLTHAQIEEAMSNTLIFTDVEEYDSPIFNDDIKLPTLYPDWTQAQKDEEYKRLVWNGWNEYKKEIPEEQHARYEHDIQQEIQTVVDTHMCDYFIMNYHIIKRGKELGGELTKTGRGSAVSFVTSKLLGFTEVDRVAAKVKMYPERFMSATRILESRTLPDIDFNVSKPAPFAQAQQEILGQEHAYPMLAYGTNKIAAAWKLYAKSQGVPFEIANQVSEQIRKYELAVKHADEDSKDDIDILDYIEPQFYDIWERAQGYIGTITSWSIAPCGYLLYQGDIRKEIGLVRIKDNICCLMDGHWAEEGHFLKNDLLTVKVVDLIYRSYDEAKLPIPSVMGLLKMCPPDDPCWDIYKKGATVGINQVEQTGTSARVQIYSPRNISELTAFVAAIRPGFKSMYKIFESRQPFSYGVKPFDDLLQTEEMPNSFMLYQEQAMAAMHYSGIPMSGTYTAVKNIAKKRVEKVLALKETFIDGFKKAIEADGANEDVAKEKAAMVWQVIEDSSSYSFNCLSGTTHIQRGGGYGVKGFNPSLEEMYLIKNDAEYAKRTGHSALYQKYKTNGYGFALSMFEDGKIRKNRIIDIYPSGVQQTYKVTTQTGAYVICTMNHSFPTPTGKKKLSELNIGDELFCKGSYEKNTHKYAFTDGNFKPNYPSKGECGFVSRPNGDSVVYHEFRNNKTVFESPCEICGTPYKVTERFEVHHKDFDRTHNEYSNYQWLCASCHKKLHYQHGRVKQYGKGIPTFIDRIVSIVPYAEETVYDIEMANPAHNFISESGLVVSNCSHAYCVALDSLYGAWIKAHYPLAFYKAYIEVQEAKGDKDKINAAKNEAESYFGIKFPPFRFGQDNRAVVANPETNEITNPLSSIKGYSKAMARLCYECSKQNYTDFVDVLAWFDQHSIKTARLLPLIKIDYFEQYGNMPTLSYICEMWDTFHQGTSKQISKASLSEELQKLFEPYLCSINAKGQELKTAKITDAMELVRTYEHFVRAQNIPDASYKVKMQNQLDILGYVDLTTRRPEDRRKLIITDCAPQRSKTSGEIWSYRIGTKSIGTGKTARLTIRTDVFDREPLAVGDIVFARDLNKNKAGYWYLNGYERLI